MIDNLNIVKGKARRKMANKQNIFDVLAKRIEEAVIAGNYKHANELLDLTARLRKVFVA